MVSPRAFNGGCHGTPGRQDGARDRRLAGPRPRDRAEAGGGRGPRRSQLPQRRRTGPGGGGPDPLPRRHRAPLPRRRERQERGAKPDRHRPRAVGAPRRAGEQRGDHPRPLDAEADRRRLTDVINTNLNSVYYCTSAALKPMIERKYGRVVNISSFVGQAGNFGQANYSASKGGVIAFTKSVAIEVAKYNVTVNAIAPGFTETDMLAKVAPEVREQILTKIPMGRFGKPEDIARAVAFLCTEGDYITGQQINVNGGVYM